MPLYFFFNATSTTEIYTLSLHDALPIYEPKLPRSDGLTRLGGVPGQRVGRRRRSRGGGDRRPGRHSRDRKSTRLNSSHGYISYAVFCLKKKKKNNKKSNITSKYTQQTIT